MTIKATKEGYTGVPIDDVAVEGKSHKTEESLRSNKAFNLTWTDSFYDNEPDILAVFDIDYPHLRGVIAGRMRMIIAIIGFYALMICPIFTSGMGDGLASYFLVFYLLCMMTILYRVVVKQIRHQKDNVTGSHVAVTKHGLRKDMHNFPLGALFRTQTLIPFDEIQSIAYVRSTNLNCCDKSVKPGTITITAKSDGTTNVIPGVCDPEALVALVRTMMDLECIKQVV